ncbi:MAG: M28 family peptidase [Lentimicrobium sp.]|jgi:subtilisin-like proprotein convertase family protein|nr:M28 family peptidase [Lentimicrobium sp.]MDY0026076.1 M28 family peptidase [Lentimicrobium sp.]
MRNFLLILSGIAFLLNISGAVKGQIVYSPLVDSLIQQSDHQSILLLTRQLAGDTTVQLGDETITILSRHFNNPFNKRAAEFIVQKFEEYGYEPEVQKFNNGRGENIIATKTGTLYPEKEFIICGHYDNMPSGNKAPGADDNASGTVAVLEAARLLSGFDFDYTLRFAAWDEEEIGLVGSYFYAQRAASEQQQIIGVLNLDMIAWDSNNDFRYSIATNALSQPFTNDFIATTELYQSQLSHAFHYTTASDHASFWQYNYPAILAIEDNDDFNAYYHTPQDDIDILNMEYYVSLVRASIANIAAQAWDQRFYFEHEPILSGNSTEAREAILCVSGSHPVDTSIHNPRCYYTTDGITFNYTEPQYISGDTIRFLLPGQSFGSTINYYFAVQDENASIIGTLPYGGKGINPPGTVAPSSFFSYQIDHVFQLQPCSSGTPVAINDQQSAIDNIVIDQAGTIIDLNVNLTITHSRTNDLRLMLMGPDGSGCLLSNRNGGAGENYINTTFDDQATTRIEEGSAPFTGRFAPESALDIFNQSDISGTWQLRINDVVTGHSGVLDNWCIHMQYYDPTTEVPVTLDYQDQLHACFPNPANNAANISFTLSQPSYVKVRLYNMMGKLAGTFADGHFEAGKHLLVASTAHLAAGRYFYTLQTERTMQTQSLVIIN